MQPVPEPDPRRSAPEPDPGRGSAVIREPAKPEAQSAESTHPCVPPSGCFFTKSGKISYRPLGPPPPLFRTHRNVFPCYRPAPPPQNGKGKTEETIIEDQVFLPNGGGGGSVAVWCITFFFPRGGGCWKFWFWCALSLPRGMLLTRMIVNIYENPCKSLKIYEILWNPLRYMGYICFKKIRWIIFYILRTCTPHISVLQREINCLNRENKNRGFRENMNFDLQNIGQSHIFHENLK